MRMVWLVFAVILWMTGESLAVGGLQPAVQPQAAGQAVRVGFLATNISDIEFARGTFYFDGYLWFRWKGPGDPSATFEVINTIDRSGLVRTPAYDRPQLVGADEFYQAVRISGKLSQPFDLTDFPLDRQRLTLKIEDQEFGYQDRYYVTDDFASGLGDQLRASNWNVMGWSMQVFSHDYGTDFGMPGGERIYSMLQFSVDLERPARYFIWKLLLPLGLLLTAALGSSLLSIRSDVRVSVPIIVLLSTLVLQQSYASILPEVGYLVLIDKIFVLAFAIMLLTALRSVLTAVRARYLEQAGAPLPPLSHAVRNNLLYIGTMFAVFAGGAWTIVLWR